MPRVPQALTQRTCLQGRVKVVGEDGLEPGGPRPGRSGRRRGSRGAQHRAAERRKTDASGSAPPRQGCAGRAQNTAKHGRRGTGRGTPT